MSENLVPSESPKRTDPNWTEYVLSLMSEKEKFNGNPRVDAMRRVVPLVLGPYIECYSKVVMPPEPGNERRAVVEYHVIVDVNGRNEHYAASADAYKGNVSSPPNKKVGFHEYPVAMAETRAAGRALRHCLGLVGVVAAEEVAELGELSGDLRAFTAEKKEITSGQVNSIQNLCKMNGININKFMNMGDGEYLSLRDVPYDVAVSMTKLLNEYRNGDKPIPEEIKV